jgi:hypothetical protein
MFRHRGLEPLARPAESVGQEDTDMQTMARRRQATPERWQAALARALAEAA